jgi:hypothetical protein
MRHKSRKNNVVILRFATRRTSRRRVGERGRSLDNDNDNDGDGDADRCSLAILSVFTPYPHNVQPYSAISFSPGAARQYF